MAEPLLEVRGLRKSYGALQASDGLDLDVLPGELHALIGPNGAGKSTLINQLSGEIRPDAGQILLDGRDITALSPHRRTHLGLARSYQITSIFPDVTALENVCLAVQSRSQYAHPFRRAASDPTLVDPARDALSAVGLAAQAGVPAYGLAHGQQRQLEIAMALALKPRLLLLDEPVAGMGQEETATVIELLARLRGEVTILLVEHDMDVVFSLADRISVLVYGRTIATGTPDRIRADPNVRQAYLGDEAA